MTTAYLGLGSNLGDRLHHLRRAIELIARRVTITAVSPIYETEPVGYAGQPWFLNCVVALETDLAPHALLAAASQDEDFMGKDTPFANGPRIIDIDLLLYGDLVMDDHTLEVPHPRMHQRRFVLAPLADIAPGVLHPTLHTTIAELLAGLPEGERVRRYAEPL